MEINVGYQKENRISLFKAALIGVPIGLVLIALLHFKIEPIYGILTPLVTGLSGLVSRFAIWLQNQIPSISQKPEVIATIGMGAITLIGVPLLKNYFSNKAARAEARAKQNEAIAINTVTTLKQTQQEALDYKTKYDELLKTGGSSNLQELLIESQNLVSSKEQQIKNLQGQVQALQDALFLKDTKVIVKTEVK